MGRWEDTEGDWPKGGSGAGVGVTDRGHLLEGIEEYVVLVEVLGLQFRLRDDRGVHFSVLGGAGGVVWLCP